jgi:hypothetical protein
MKTKLLILMSMVLLSTVSLISCKESLEGEFGKKTYSKTSKLYEAPPKSFVNELRGKTQEEKGWEIVYDPGDIREINPNGHDDTGSGGGGGGGGGGGTPVGLNITVANFNIKIRVLPPCVKAPVIDLLNKIGNYDSVLDDILKKFNNNNNTFNYTITQTTGDDMIKAGLKEAPACTRKNSDGSGWVTILNKDFLEYASQEYIISVLLHEMYHIKSEQEGHVDFANEKYFFTSNYIDRIKDDLKLIYNLDDETAKALALAGAAGGGNPVTAYGITVQKIVQISEQYQSAAKGTKKCEN